MVKNEQQNKRIALAVFSAMAAVFFCVIFCAGDALASKYRANRHFLSWESLQRPEQYRRMLKKSPPLHRFKVRTSRVAKLKTSSFWNLRPYQFATPLVEGDRLFVGSDSRRFYAYDALREKKLWVATTEGPVHARAAFADGTVYFGDTKAIVYALDAEDGKEKWRTVLDAEILAAPLVLGSWLYVADMSGRLYALDRATGVESWHTDPNDRSIGFSVRRAAAPVESNGLILLGTASGALLAYRAPDGSLAWVRQLGNKQSQVYDVDSTPLVVGSKIYAASADGETFCLEAATGRVIWTADAGGANDVILHNGRVYASGGGVLSALDPENGNIFWQQDLETPEVSSPGASENYIALTTTVDKFYLIDGENGDIAYERFIGNGSFGDPVLSGDRIYFLTNAGRLHSYKVKEVPVKKPK